MAFVQDVASGEAGSLEATEGETTQAIRRRLSAAAEALGRTLETRRNGNTVYFWVSEGRRRGRPRKNPRGVIASTQARQGDGDSKAIEQTVRAVANRNR